VNKALKIASETALPFSRFIEANGVFCWRKPEIKAGMALHLLNGHSIGRCKIFRFFKPSQEFFGRCNVSRLHKIWISAKIDAALQKSKSVPALNIFAGG
jgi:hypothetical protein